MLTCNADVKYKVHCFTHLSYNIQLVKNITRAIADDEVDDIGVKIY